MMCPEGRSGAQRGSTMMIMRPRTRRRSALTLARTLVRTPARAARTAILAAATLLLASTAGAVPTFTLLSPSSLTVALGEEFTIQIALDNPGGTSVVGVDGQLTGLLASGATVVSGRTARVHFTGFCTASNCF